MSEDVVAPKGWETARLADCVDVLDSRRKPVNAKERAARPGGIPYYGATGQVGWIDDYLFDEELVLVGEDGAPFLDKSKPIAYVIDGKSWVNNHAHVLRARAEMTSNRYIKHYLDSFDFTNRVQGSTRDKLTQGTMNTIPVVLAPRPLQDRIVGVIDAVASRRVVAYDRLSVAQRAIDRLRQAILAAACSGRLTSDWREHNPEVEGAEKLVSQSAYTIAEPEEGFAELPEKWVWVALGSYARCSRGRFSVRPRNDPSCFGGEHPFIQIGNLNPDGGWVRSHTQTLNEKGLSVSKKFPKGTAVIAIVGATIGNTGLLAYDMCFPDSLVGLETGTPEGNRFVELFLRHRKHAIRRSSYSSGGQPNIKLESLNPYPLALPPLAEQQQIIHRVDQLLARADELQRRVESAARSIERSSQALLAKAFRGELIG